MNEDQQATGDDWAGQLLAHWLDDDFQPSVDALRHRGWSALPVADSLNPMEAEWLADAIRSARNQAACGVGFEHRSRPDVVVVSAERDALLRFNGANSWRFALLTSQDVGFLYFKDEANRFYLLCGPSSFVDQAYRCSWETARIMYFDYWVDLEHNTAAEKRFLKRVWDKYSGFRPG